MKQTKREGVTERHLPKTDYNIVRPMGEHLKDRYIEMKRNENGRLSAKSP